MGIVGDCSNSREADQHGIVAKAPQIGSELFDRASWSILFGRIEASVEREHFVANCVEVSRPADHAIRGGGVARHTLQAEAETLSRLAHRSDEMIVLNLRLHVQRIGALAEQAVERFCILDWAEIHSLPEGEKRGRRMIALADLDPQERRPEVRGGFALPFTVERRPGGTKSN